jgi:hypothetical protein
MLHFITIPHVQTQSNWVCNFHVRLLLLVLPSDHTFFQIEFIHCDPSNWQKQERTFSKCWILLVPVFTGIDGSLHVSYRYFQLTSSGKPNLQHLQLTALSILYGLPFSLSHYILICFVLNLIVSGKS